MYGHDTYYVLYIQIVRQSAKVIAISLFVLWYNMPTSNKRDKQCNPREVYKL